MTREETDMTTSDRPNMSSHAPIAGVASNNSLTDLGDRINEAHIRAIEHAGKALGHAIACGEMLLEAKAKVPHGQWLPWLRKNITCGERSAQGYMRIAKRVPDPIRNGVADLSVRDALQYLATPRREMMKALDAELDAWSAQSRAAQQPVEDWTVEDAQACIKRLRAFDELMHRHGICPLVGTPDACLCLVCADEVDAEKQGEQHGAKR
jgi:Protein of unknown function (DUF3102)